MDIRQRNMGLNAGELGQSWDQTFNAPMAPPNAGAIMGQRPPMGGQQPIMTMNPGGPIGTPPPGQMPTHVDGMPMGLQPGVSPAIQPHPNIMPVMRGGPYGR